MAWTTPKTDWVSTDYFNYSDYTRIKGNLEYLVTLVNEVYSELTISTMTAKTSYSDYIYADEINLFETNLQAIHDWIAPIDIGSRMTFYENAPFIMYTELNRIESAQLTIYNNLLGQINGRLHLSFTLNGGTIQV